MEQGVHRLDRPKHQTDILESTGGEYIESQFLQQENVVPTAKYLNIFQKGAEFFSLHPK